MNVIGIAWDVVKCEVNLTSWYECKQDESRFFGNCSPLGNLLPLRYGPLGNCATNPPSAVDLECQS